MPVCIPRARSAGARTRNGRESFSSHHVKLGPKARRKGTPRSTSEYLPVFTRVFVSCTQISPGTSQRGGRHVGGRLARSWRNSDWFAVTTVEGFLVPFRLCWGEQRVARYGVMPLGGRTASTAPAPAIDFSSISSSYGRRQRPAGYPRERLSFLRLGPFFGLTIWRGW